MPTDREAKEEQERQPQNLRWWVATGLTAIFSMILAFMLLVAIAVGVIEGAASMDPLIELLLVSLPFFLAGVITGLTGGVRRWWLLVPGLAAAVAVHLGAVGGGLFGLTLAAVASVAASRMIVVRRGSSPSGPATAPTAEL